MCVVAWAIIRVVGRLERLLIHEPGVKKGCANDTEMFQAVLANFQKFATGPRCNNLSAFALELRRFGQATAAAPKDNGTRLRVTPLRLYTRIFEPVMDWAAQHLCAVESDRSTVRWENSV
jgi:hypothetical protein